MSAYYYIVKKKIVHEKQFLGLGFKFFYYLIYVVGIACIWNFMSYVNSPRVLNKDDTENYIFLASMLGCYISLRVLNSKFVMSSW